MSYQTVVVHVLGVASIFLALVAGNISNLDITNPWVTLVVIPGLVGAIYYCGNQMKTIGQPAPGTTKTTQTTERTTEPPK